HRLPHPLRRPNRHDRRLARTILGPPIRTQCEKGRVTNTAIARPLGKANLGDERRLDPVMSASRWRPADERRRRARQRPERLADRLERPVVETRADLGHVHELTALVEPEVQRAEVSAGALRHGVAADHELLPEPTLDLEPVPGALRGVLAVATLGDHTLQA